MDVMKWFKAAGVRALRTAAQSAIAFVGTASVMGEVDWVMCGSAVLLATLLSLLTSVAGIPEVEDGTSPLAKKAEPE